tara:strand:+ start:591 stop:971 length:381 start_codon:yes stop_codon:yes gene_type:complete
MAKGFGEDIQVSSPRVNELKRKVKGLVASDDIMFEILSVFRKTEIIPDVGKYYTFIYTAKTNDIKFDQFPLIACVDVQRWGFKGLNFHWGSVKNYTWQEVEGFLHVIENNEIDYLRSLNYANFIDK